MTDPNDDEWLYGSGGDNPESEDANEAKQDEVEMLSTAKSANIEKTFETFDEHNFEEAGDHEQLVAEDSKDGNDESQEGEDDDSDDDDDDDINVVIGDIKSGGPSAYTKGTDPKQKQPGSKFNIEEFESVGTINGQPAFEFAIESIEDKPWRKPGADITDYFNYGFNEETWRSYCERQKRIRIHESGVGLASLTAAQNPQQGNSGDMIRPNINIGFKRLGGPRLPKPPHIGTIDVIGAPSQNPIRPPAPRENVIQVMTADRREYSRTVVNQPQMPMQFNVPPEDFYHEEPEQFYGYEPTQDSQGWDNQGWAPSEIKELTPMNQPPPMNPMQGPPLNIPPPMMGNMGGHRMLPMMPPQNSPIPSLIGNANQMSMPIKQEMDDKRDNRRMGNRDFRDDRRRDDDRKRMRERSTSRDRDPRKLERSTRDERPRDDRSRSDRDRYAREQSSRSSRRSKSRERSDRNDRNKRSRSRDKIRSKSRDRKADDKDRSRSDKSKRSKKEDS